MAEYDARAVAREIVEALTAGLDGRGPFIEPSALADRIESALTAAYRRGVEDAATKDATDVECAWCAARPRGPCKEYGSNGYVSPHHVRRTIAIRSLLQETK